MVALVQTDDNDTRSWDDILGRVLGGLGDLGKPDVWRGGEQPTVYDPAGTAGTTDYMPLLVIALVIVAIVVLSKQ